MADEYHSSGICSSTGNWWNSGISSNNSRNGLSSSSSPCSTTTHISSDNNIGSSGGGGSYGWCSNNNDHHQMMDMIKTKSNCDQQSSSSVSISGSSSIVYQSSDHTQRPPEQAGSDSIGGGGGHHLDAAAAAGSVLMDSNLQMMGFDLSSSPTTDWTQTLLGRSNSGRAAETNFQSMLQESHDHGQVHHHNEEDSSSIHAYKQMNNQVFNSLDPQCFNSNKSSAADCIVTYQGLPMNFSMNSSATTYECPPSSTLLHGLYDPVIDQQSSHDENQMNYCMNSNDLSSSWSSKFPQFLKSTTVPTKEQPSTNNQLQFSNNAQFWNASSSAMMTDIRSSLFSSPRNHFLPPTLDDQKPNCSNISLKSNRDEVKKTSTEPAFKRPRIETPLPTFKVRKEKLGDRITALQQLCSPFGKTDTASVLFEAIEYIKFLHDQVSALSNPYMKSGAPQQYQQNLDKSKDGEGLRKDLRSRGLCLVPISSTFTVTNEASTDFWTPTFGGTYR